ncbi:MAG TPA: MAPEG family protein [Allosphingosinicella sp.]|nr:MAPEG family protein [Allosphingosinicella sp.]
MTVLSITLTAAGAAALLNIWIAMRIGTLRRQHGILFGDGGNPQLLARMRAQSNFVEYAPFFLILLALIELARGQSLWLWLATSLFILGRILHVFGMDRPTVNPLRGAGIGLSMLTLVGLAIWAIAIPYLHRDRAPAINYTAQSPAQAPDSTLSATNGLVRRS